MLLCVTSGGFVDFIVPALGSSKIAVSVPVPCLYKKGEVAWSEGV